jgi:hypothetical protein
MLDSREVLSHCDLQGKRNVRVRLDRAIASLSWSDRFPDAKVQHIVSSRLDHCPIFLNLERGPRLQKGQRLFWYEIMWEREESLLGEIQDAWQ